MSAEKDKLAAALNTISGWLPHLTDDDDLRDYRIAEPIAAIIRAADEIDTYASRNRAARSEPPLVVDGTSEPRG